MSDNRNFVNKFANEGGGDIYVEDAKLSEISTKTAIASEGVMLKGTDGAYYEIDKASLSEVIRAELGAILADNSHDNGTSVAKVPTLNSTDNVLGSSSIANLASVLGGEEEKNYFTMDLYNTAVTDNSDGAGYFGMKSFLSLIPQGKAAYAVVWHTDSFVGGITLGLNHSAVTLCSPTSITIPYNKVVRVYYR